MNVKTTLTILFTLKTHLDQMKILNKEDDLWFQQVQNILEMFFMLKLLLRVQNQEIYTRPNITLDQKQSNKVILDF